MAELRILDNLDETIAIVNFMRTAMLAITEQRKQLLDERDAMGMNLIFYHVEDRLKGIEADVREALPLNLKIRESATSMVVEG